MNILDTLVTDRTQEDVTRLSYLNTLNWDTMTKAQRYEWLYGRADETIYWSDGEVMACTDGTLYCYADNPILRGAYNYTDLNRVGNVVACLADMLRETVGTAVNVSPKTDWKMSDIPTSAQMEHYLDCVSAIRAVLSLWPTTPPLPSDMSRLTYQEANDIEQILLDIRRAIQNTAAAWYYSGEMYSGEV